MSDEARQAELEELAMAMALLDMGQVGDARERIAAVLERAGVADASTADAAATDAPAGDGLFGEPFDEAGPFGGQLNDDELDGAFESAESRREEMLDVNQVAQEAIRFEELGEPETLFSPEEHPNFATETMAALLERQGDPRSAQSIRSGLVLEGESEADAGEWLGSSRDLGLLDAAEAPVPTFAEPAGLHGDESRVRIVATLERWLANLQRGAA